MAIEPAAERHEQAARTHEAAARRHEEAMRFWDARGEGELSELERRSVELELTAAQLERDKAAAFRRREGLGSAGWNPTRD